jgi:AraC family transcriptional regulator, transcriptional activator FtrA
MCYVRAMNDGHRPTTLRRSAGQRPRPRNRRHQVVVPVFDGLPLFELAVPCEVFGRDRRDLHQDWYEFSLCSAAAATSVSIMHGAVLDPGHGPAKLDTADTIVVPACCDPEYQAPVELIAALRRAAARGARIVGLCSGTFVLAQAGLLDGREATTHWLHAERLARCYPGIEVRSADLYVRAGNLYTSAGTAAGIDLCLHLVTQDLGAAVAAEIARRMVVAPHRGGDQAQYLPPVHHPQAPSTTPAGSEGEHTLAATLEWALTQLDRELTVAELAQYARMSLRTFNRRFRAQVGTSPLRWLTRQRLDRARTLLETSDLTVERITDQCGYTNTVTLRQHFHRAFGITPTTYRQRFATNPTHPPDTTRTPAPVPIS